MRYFTAALAVLLCVCALTALLPSCSVGGEYIAYTVARPDKFMDGTSSTARVALYVDPAVEDYRQILTDVGKYSIRQKGKVLPYFDYVILGGAAIKRGGGSLAKLVMSEQLQAVLNERDTLLRPLRWRGIKILLGVTEHLLLWQQKRINCLWCSKLWIYADLMDWKALNSMTVTERAQSKPPIQKSVKHFSAENILMENCCMRSLMNRCMMNSGQEEGGIW